MHTILNRRRVTLAQLAVVCILLGPISNCLSYQNEQSKTRSSYDLSLRGFVDVGISYSDTEPSWLDYGTGKGRYGASGNRRLSPHLSEAQLIADLMFGPSIKVHTSLKHADEQANAIDVLEAYVRYKSGPLSKPRWQIKLGSFLPPISLENTAIGWTSPYSLTSSAINSWVGEELRINGAELRTKFRLGENTLELLGAAFLANDAAGTLLAYRGWAIHDHEVGLFGDLPIPQFQIEIQNPRGAFAQQANRFEPLHEIDGRVGAYLGGSLTTADYGKFTFLAYDNNADPEAINRTAGQYAWDTSFISIGHKMRFSTHYTSIIQMMYGETLMGPKITRTASNAANQSSRIVDAAFFSAMGLINRQFGNKSLTLRGEYFEIQDDDIIRGVYDNTEDGFAITAAGNLRAHARLKLCLELQYLNHERPVRRFALEPVEIEEITARLNARFFF